jgi:hypothetical protein
MSKEVSLAAQTAALRSSQALETLGQACITWLETSNNS